MNNDILRLENVSKFYKSANNVALGIRKVNVSFKMGEFVLITGASGSGKSTLLNVLSGMTSYEEGVMYINGEDSSYFGNLEYENYRKDYIACIFQNYNIIDSFNVYENIELALIAKGVSKSERKELVLDVAKKVGISHRLKHKVTKLSGGEKQRVAIARALVSDAPILVCDEITGNLDHDTSIEIVKLLYEVSKDKLVLMVTHDPEEVMEYATRIISMHDGMIQNDKVLKDVKDIEEVTIKDTKPIKKKEIFRLAGKSFKNTPKKSILLILILLAATIFIGFACAAINMEIDGGYGYFYASSNYDKKRILVKRQDGNVLTQDDYTKFSNVSEVKHTFKRDFLLDYMLYGSYNDYENGIYYSAQCFILPISMISQNDLTAGSMPQNTQDVIIRADESNYESLKQCINKIFEFRDNSNGVLYFDANLTGYIISNESHSAIIYLQDEYCKMIEEISLGEKLEFQIEADSMKYFYRSPIFKSDTLPNKTVINFLPKWYDETQTNEVAKVKWSGGELENVNIISKEYETIKDALVANNVGSAQYLKEGYDYFQGLIVSSDIYESLNQTAVYETSIYASDANDVSGIIKKLNNNGYIAIQAYYERPTGDSISNIILSIFLYIFCIVLTGLVYLLSYLSLKNVIFKEKKDLLIMRSLGMNAKQVTSQIYIKLIGTSLVTLLLFVITSIILHQFYFPTYHVLYPISKMRITQMIYAFLLIMIMTFFLSRKFAKNIFKSNIASKDKEDTIQ